MKKTPEQQTRSPTCCCSQSAPPTRAALSTNTFLVSAEDLELQQAVEASFATSMPKSATPCYIASREPKLCCGCCLVSDVLSTDACAEVYEACQRAEREMLAFDPDRVGNRDRGRYSFGAACEKGSMLHERAWALKLLDNPQCIQLLRAIFKEAGGFHIWGAGGDFVRGHHCCCCC